jgi:hypothetical protein
VPSSRGSWMRMWMKINCLRNPALRRRVFWGDQGEQHREAETMGTYFGSAGSAALATSGKRITLLVAAGAAMLGQN